MGGTCEVDGCDMDARWIRVSHYAEGAVLYVCDLHFDRIRLRSARDAEHYAGLPLRQRLAHEVSSIARFSTPSRDLT